MSEHLAYYERERRIAADPTDPRHILPTFPLGARVLDVGCGVGWEGQEQGTSLFAGVDPDHEAILCRKNLTRDDFPSMSLQGRGEDLHQWFPPDHFTFVMGRVSLPYMDANAFLAEAFRVLQPGGKIWLTYHDASVPLRELRQSLRDRNVRGILYRLYVLLNGLAFHLWGGQYRYPLKRSRFSSFQTEGGLHAALRRAGFGRIEFARVGQHFLVTAERPAGT